MSKSCKAFVIGVGQVLDMGGTRVSHTGRNAKTGQYLDSKALSSDWKKVGKALSTAMNEAGSNPRASSLKGGKTVHGR
jgi:hypothetical protein